MTAAAAGTSNTGPTGSGRDELARVAGGPALVPADDGYAQACATWNLTIEQRPALVVTPADSAGIAAAVAFAARHDLPVGVQATGHGAPAPCRGGVLVNTSGVTTVTVDGARSMARVEAGATWAQVIAAAAPHGLAPASGSSPLVSATGYTSGGGHPVLARSLGFAVDSVRSFDLVTAAGAQLTVDPAREPDLFWGVRGGTGNFGVITSMEIDLHPVPVIFGGAAMFPGERFAEVLGRFAAWAAGAPDELTTSLALLHIPPAAPSPLAGRVVVVVRGAYAGTADEARPHFAPIAPLGPPLVDTMAERPCARIGEVFADPVNPVASSLELRQLGGATGRKPERDSAILRTGDFLFLQLGAVAGPGDRTVEHVEHDLLDDLAPRLVDGGVPNFLGQDVTVERLGGCYGPAGYDRLVALKDRWDPGNRFRFNLNIPLPTATT